MRTSDLIVGISLLGVAFGLSPAAVSFDGTRTPEGAPVSTPMPAPGTNALGNVTPLAAVPPAATNPIALPQRQAPSAVE